MCHNRYLANNITSRWNPKVMEILPRLTAGCAIQNPPLEWEVNKCSSTTFTQKKLEGTSNKQQLLRVVIFGLLHEKQSDHMHYGFRVS